METENRQYIDHIQRRFDNTPTVINAQIKENCMFENTAVGGIGTIIINKEFIDDILATMNEEEVSKNLVELLTNINNKVNNYFYSQTNSNENSRDKEYNNNLVLNEEGMVIGTKLSSLKGKNIALCSEKSIAAYIILENLYNSGKIKRKPSLVLSSLKTENTSAVPHAFMILDSKEDKYPTKHLLYDIENPTKLKDINNNELYFVSIYSLNDEQHENIINGNECTPKSLYEELNKGLQEIGDKRIYGSKKLNKAL